MNQHVTAAAAQYRGGSNTILIVTVATSTILAACALYSCYLQHKEHTMSKELHRVRMLNARG